MVMITKQTKIMGVTSLLATLAACILFGLGLYIIERTEDTLAAKRHAVAESRFRVEEIVSLSKLVEASSEERDALAQYVLHNDDVISFLMLVEAIGAKQGVSLEIPKLNEVPLNDTFDELRITITLEGGYDAVVRALTVFESLPYQSHISNVSITRVGITQLWTAGLTIHITKYKTL